MPTGISKRTVSDLEFSLDAERAVTMYAGVEGQGIKKSSDGGKTWAPMAISEAPGHPLGAQRIGTITIAADHALGSPHGLYAAITDRSKCDEFRNSPLIDVFTLLRPGFDGLWLLENRPLRPTIIPLLSMK